MRNELNKRLLQCRHITNHAEPYVWRLHLTLDEFQNLDQCIRDSISQHQGSHSHLISVEYSLILITYLAEWYKRKYQANYTNTTDKAVELTSQELKQLWHYSGINTDIYVYRTDSGINLWLYSIYVLGGLAIQHELGRNDNGKFLKALCRIYHGDEYSLENIDEENRAIAFRHSIFKKHSLYEYLREMLSGTFSDNDKQVQSLLTNIRKANDEVLKSKFRFEWIVTYNSFTATMCRRLRVWLNPEEVGAGLHQYLKFDRIHLWGIVEPQKLKLLHFSIRWMNGEKVVADIDKKKPLISYSNTGDDNGFVSWGVTRFAVFKAIPSRAFTHFQIIAFDDSGNEYLAQQENATEWMQLWRIDPWTDEWSSRQSAQHQTAVLFNDTWYTDVEPDGRKAFYNKNQGNSNEWNFCYISSSITLYNKVGKEITLYNRIGYDQIYTELYKDTICYLDGGLVSYIIEDEEEGSIEERLPLIFKREDIRVRFFATKDAIENAEVQGDSLVDELEFRLDSGRYILWNENNTPDFGIVFLRICVKGIVHRMKVLYLQGNIVRDFNNCAINYFTMDGEARYYQDIIAMDKTPLAPFVPIQIGNIRVQVFRPTLIKEIYLDGSIHGYHCNLGHKVIPYILKNRIKIVDFSERGYHIFECKNLKSIYPHIGSNDNAAIACWENGDEWEASLLNENAPKWLHVNFGKPYNKSDDKDKFLLWSIYKDEEPKEIDCETFQKGDIIFQNMATLDEDFTYISPHPRPLNPFNGKKIESIELKCFEIASHYQVYFIVFQPLRKIGSEKDVEEKLLRPLLNKRDGKLTELDIENLIRFADEFQLSLEEVGLNIE